MLNRLLKELSHQIKNKWNEISTNRNVEEWNTFLDETWDSADVTKVGRAEGGGTLETSDVLMIPFDFSGTEVATFMNSERSAKWDLNKLIRSKGFDLGGVLKQKA